MFIVFETSSVGRLLGLGERNICIWFFLVLWNSKILDHLKSCWTSKDPTTEPGLKMCKRKGHDFSGTDFFFNPLWLGAKVSSNSISCGKRGYGGALIHSEVVSIGIWGSVDNMRRVWCKIPHQSWDQGSRRTEKPLNQSPGEPGWASDFRESYLCWSCFLPPWVSAFPCNVCSVVPCCLLSSLMAFRMFSHLPSFLLFLSGEG